MRRVASTPTAIAFAVICLQLSYILSSISCFVVQAPRRRLGSVSSSSSLCRRRRGGEAEGYNIYRSVYNDYDGIRLYVAQPKQQQQEQQTNASSNNKRNNDKLIGNQKRQAYRKRRNTHNDRGNFSQSGDKRLLIQTFKRSKQLEQTGDYLQSIKLLRKCIEIDRTDSYSYLALARLTQKLDGIDCARSIFQAGVANCGEKNVHLLQAWATLEMKSQNTKAATELFEQALQIDHSNPYVCHSYGLLSLGMEDVEKARRLWKIPLDHG